MVSHGSGWKAVGGNPPSEACPRASPGACVSRISPSLPPASAAPVFCGNRKRALPLFADVRAGLKVWPADAETWTWAPAVAHPISPELALVCPELREQALSSLPPLDPDALFEVAHRPEPWVRTPPRPRLAVVQPSRRRPAAGAASGRRRRVCDRGARPRAAVRRADRPRSRHRASCSPAEAPIESVGPA